MTPILTTDFFAQDTLQVAKALLGKHLVSWSDLGHCYVTCKIVETEAYTQTDPACHAYKGARGRALTLFKDPGFSYVYFIYGMYYCLNVVTEPKGLAGAVLLRALEPLDLIPGEYQNTKGPGRLCKALGITRDTHNEHSMITPGGKMHLCEGATVSPHEIVTSTRIGLSIAQDYPWRFYLQDNPWVSVKARIPKPAKGKKQGQ